MPIILAFFKKNSKVDKMIKVLSGHRISDGSASIAGNAPVPSNVSTSEDTGRYWVYGSQTACYCLHSLSSASHRKNYVDVCYPIQHNILLPSGLTFL